MRAMINRLSFGTKQVFQNQSNKMVCVNSAKFSDIFKDRETAQEKVFINKEEKKILQKLLNKLGETNQPKDKKTTSTKEEERAVLDKILQKHKVKFSDDIIEDLFLWKNGSL